MCCLSTALQLNRLISCVYLQVQLVRKKDTKKLYAMKSLQKEKLLRQRQIEHTQVIKCSNRW